MESNGKNAGAVTPAKGSKSNRSRVSEASKDVENSNPNVSSPGLNVLHSSATKSATKTQRSASKNPNPISSPSPRNKIRERKFVVAKKNSKREKPVSSTAACKCKIGGKSNKCLCVAYETLRASQEEFFKNRGVIDDECELESLKNSDGAQYEVELGEEKNHRHENCDEGKYGQITCPETNTGLENGIDQSDESGSANTKRTREKMLEEARKNVPEPGSGKVSHLVKAFEKLLSIPKTKESNQIDEEKETEDAKKGVKWALPGLQPRVLETQVSSSSFCPSDFFLTSESLGLDSRRTSSLDSNHGSISRRNSGGGRSSRRNSADSTGSFGGRKLKRRQHRVTSQKPFKLRTEERGRSKEEEFVKKVQQMMTEEEKQRIPIAQGLPWTTDEPECLAKPPVKESTRPVDLVLHSDVRAVERSEFDHQVAEKLSFIELYKLERERQQKLEEEEEIRRLRKELVPRAQPMPYFDRPFIPRRSEKNPTIPKEPRFHLPQHKKMKCYMSWNDMLCTSQQ